MGDSPIAGAGLFADNKLGAVSTTGQGESLYRGLVAVRIAEKLDHQLNQYGSAQMEQGLCKDGSSVIRETMDQMTARCGGDGGAIAIDTKGRIAIEWNSLRMAWAYTILDNTLVSKTCEAGSDMVIEVHSGCNANEHFREYLHLAEF